MTNGAQALVQTLLDSGVTTCFTNPGTSEMHFVAALDTAPDMRAVLTLFEGVATGAADGYARMAERPAATLLHLGCGLGNGLANLHNARKAGVPMVNIVGEHATTHQQYDAPLQSDIDTVARNVSTWVRTSTASAQVSSDTAEAVAVATGSPNQIATLILPADASWNTGAQPHPPRTPTPPADPDPTTIAAVAAVLRSDKRSAILLGGRALREPLFTTAARIAAAADTPLFAEVFPTRIQRGAGTPVVTRLAYFAEMASAQLKGVEHLVLVDAKAPVSFFAYPGKPGALVPDGCHVHQLATADQDAGAALTALIDALDAHAVPPRLSGAVPPKAPRGALTAEKVCQAIGAALPANAIISDEAQTGGVTLPAHTAGSPAHDVLTLTGGAIGQGLPVALGAAIACPDRPVLALTGDGSALYTIQALWTMAREQLNITTVILNNRSYAILNVELQRVGARSAGPAAKSQLDLTSPAVDFVHIAKGFGVPARRVDTAEELNTALAQAFNRPGPHLIDAVIPNDLSGFKLKALPLFLNALSIAPRSIGSALVRRVLS